MKLNTKREGWVEQALLRALEEKPPMPLGTLVRLIAREHDKPNTRALHESARRAAKRLWREGRVQLGTVTCPTAWHEPDDPIRSSVRRVLVVFPPGPLPSYTDPEPVWVFGFGPDREEDA